MQALAGKDPMRAIPTSTVASSCFTWFEENAGTPPTVRQHLGCWARLAGDTCLRFSLGWC